MKRATIDIGSNSILLLAGGFQNEEITEVLNESRITSLGKNLDKEKKFEKESMENSFFALKEYAELLKANGFIVSDTIVTATEASRVASNSAEFFGRIKDEIGFLVTIINSEAEAHYTALGVLTSLHSDSHNEHVIMDIGGASTELMLLKKDPYKLLETISMPIGSVRATDWIEDQKIVEKFQDIEKKFPIDRFKVDTLVCVAGSMTALGALYLKQENFKPDELEGLRITKENFLAFLSDLEIRDPEALLKEYAFLGKRIKSIRGGVWVAKNLVNRICTKDILISTRGLRYGTFITGKIDEKFIVTRKS